MRTLALVSLLMSVLVNVGCTGQRSLETVRNDGDKAFFYKRFDEARADYQEVVDRDPSDWRYRVKLARMMMIMGDDARAEELLAVVLRVRPNDDDVAGQYAEAMFKAGHRDRLISFLERRAADSRAVADYLQLGSYAVKTGDADLAERALLTAARLDGGATVGPQLALADLYLAAGDRAEALRRLRMALGVDPSNEIVQQRIRALGEVPGPSFALTPDDDR